MSAPRRLRNICTVAADHVAMSDYLPIEQHGIIGDLHTVALVGTEGTIDWYCPERFHSPSIFASILDAGGLGHFRISPVESEGPAKQLYFPDTNVVLARFLRGRGV